MLRVCRVRSHGGYSTDPAAIEAEIAHLRSLALDALRQHWRVSFGRTPPVALSKDLLGRMIAYRLQERAFGGLDRESLRFLHGLARHGGSPRRRLKPGTVLVRDYQGQRHTVTVVCDGFDWQGATYPSLSAIARAITGTAWSGPRFFALARGKGALRRYGATEQRDEFSPSDVDCHATLPRGSCNGGEDIIPNRAALRDFKPAYVGLGSKREFPHFGLMSASSASWSAPLMVDSFRRRF